MFSILIEISQQINVEGERIPRTICKKFESSIVPSLGMKIEDVGWKNPYNYEVTEVIINYNENTAFVTVAPYVNIVPANKIEEFLKIEENCGWKRLGK